MEKLKRGLLIVLEGIDGAGKTTHAKLLVEWLKEKGYTAFLTEEPTGGEIGTLIRNQLLKKTFHPATMALLFAADRVEHVEKVLKPRIMSGEIVVSDRYTESSICYQANEGLDIEWLESLNKLVPSSDLTILLDVEVQVAIKRIKDRRVDKYEEEKFLEKVRELYLKRAKEKRYAVVDATPPVEEVQMEIRKLVTSLLAKYC